MTGFTRRDALAAAALLPMRLSAAPAVDEPAIRAAARAGKRSFGAAVQTRQLADAPFCDAILAQCDSLTPELALKWAALQPGEGAFDFRAMDAIAAFARAHRRRIHGHTLLWHRSVPEWAPAAMARDGWEAVHRYFATVIGRYGDLVDRWDVVNEPVEPQDDADGLRRSAFHAAFGPDYVRRALDSARELAPHARLLINEYGLEHPIAEEERRRARLLRLIDDLKRRNAPLDGIGIQGHLRLDRGAIDQTRLARFLQDIADRGLVVFVTELDVREADFDLPIERRDAAVAATVRAFLDVALAQRAVQAVTTWGLSDRYSWLNEDGEIGTRHAGGNRGLPLDAALRPTPFHAALLQAFGHARPAVHAPGRPAAPAKASRTTAIPRQRAPSLLMQDR